MQCVTRRVQPKTVDELPEWLPGLKGYDVIAPATTLGNCDVDNGMACQHGVAAGRVHRHR